jgi:hypothetical protein
MDEIRERNASKPLVVSMAQARVALSNAGLLAAVNSAAAASPATAIAWEYATELHRDSPTLLGLGAALKLSSAQIDALFVTASKVTF